MPRAKVLFFARGIRHRSGTLGPAVTMWMKAAATGPIGGVPSHCQRSPWLASPLVPGPRSSSRSSSTARSWADCSSATSRSAATRTGCIDRSRASWPGRWRMAACRTGATGSASACPWWPRARSPRSIRPTWSSTASWMSPRPTGCRCGCTTWPSPPPRISMPGAWASFPGARRCRRWRSRSAASRRSTPATSRSTACCRTCRWRWGSPSDSWHPAGPPGWCHYRWSSACNGPSAISRSRPGPGAWSS